MTYKIENSDKVAFIQRIKMAISDSEFIHSAYYLGTPRKIKRVLNALVMSNLYGKLGRFKDRVNEELLYLLLLYIYHPEIFRDVFNYETDGKRGYFSLVTSYDISLQKKLGEDRFHERDTVKQFNSQHFHNYIKKVNSPEAVFLLRKLFDANQKFPESKTTNYISLGEDQKASWACFNGSLNTPKNLEDYLRFITDSSYSPDAGSQHATYAEMVDMLMQDKKSFNDLLKESFFDGNKEEKLEKLLEVYFNSIGRFGTKPSEDQINNMISSLIDVRNKIAYYSIKKSNEENEDFFSHGYRKSLDYRLVKLMEIGFYGQQDKLSYNKWIKRHLFDQGNIFAYILTDKSVNILMNLNDILSIRLYLCVDRGGQNHRIGSALYDLYLKELRVDIVNSYDNDFLVNEMREVTQHIYSIIKKEIIDKEISLIEECNNLSLIDVDPSYIQGDSYDNDDFLRLKERLLSFVLYQISCTENSWGSGLAMGKYDLSGNKDLNGIKKDFTKYLIKCFEKNHKNYWQYIAISGGRRYIDEERKLKYSKEALFGVTDRDLLIEFTSSNKVMLLGVFPEIRLSIQNEIVDLSEPPNMNDLLEFFEDICNLSTQFDNLNNEEKNETKNPM